MHLQNDIGKTEVEIVIAYAGIEGIAHCTINVIAEARCQQQVPLLVEETTWEGNLRKAGMNAWAAQIVLTCLDVEDGGGEVEVWKALARLVAVNEREKLEMLSEAMGDKGMAKRVSLVLSRMVQ